MAEHSLEISKVVWEKVELKRIPTSEELELIKQREYFDLPDDLIVWDESEVSDEDYSFGLIRITLNDEIVFEKRGRH
jgi:hypothetical protein